MKRLLLLSNSTMPGTPYLSWAKPHIDNFLGDVRSIAFVPYAAVGFSYDEYTRKLREGLEGTGIEVKSVHQSSDPVLAIQEAESIAVGGGNTFQLLKMMQEQKLISAIREKVENGTPYMGWSAGSNVSTPSIKTTNDMPIAQPESFEALNLYAHQINPHYTEKSIEGHGGESRKQRLKEYCAINTIPVICLPEGTGIRQEGEVQELIGSENALIMDQRTERWIEPGRFSI